jgi:hypothetical protein
MSHVKVIPVLKVFTYLKRSSIGSNISNSRYCETYPNIKENTTRAYARKNPKYNLGTLTFYYPFLATVERSASGSNIWSVRVECSIKCNKHLRGTRMHESTKLLPKPFSIQPKLIIGLQKHVKPCERVSLWKMRVSSQLFRKLFLFKRDRLWTLHGMFKNHKNMINLMNRILTIWKTSLRFKVYLNKDWTTPRPPLSLFVGYLSLSLSLTHTHTQEMRWIGCMEE